MKLRAILTLLAGMLLFQAYSQNIVITDDETYTIPENSAMLDVKSITKGMLVPRVTENQRINISNPATGLLVFDTDHACFYFYNGTLWVNLSHSNANNVWHKSGQNVYLNSEDFKVGINKPNPLSTLEVKANSTSLDTDPLFQVINKDGDTVFAVYSDGVAVTFDESAKGNIGGFAVSGKSVTKGNRDYLRVTSDSTRIYLNETTKGNIGGFAVSGKAVTKGAYDEFLRVTPDSTRIWVNKGSKGNIGGFAVSGRAVTKGVDEPMFVSTFDSTRIYIDQPAKGNIGGFAVSGREVTKGSTTNFLDLTPENYFIGHESGKGNTGTYNQFVGYQTGQNANSGNNNMFIGYQAGFSNQSGYNNVFNGFKAGYSNNSGISNVFVGDSAGYYNTGGDYNVVIGSGAGVKSNADYNTILGYKAGYYTNDGGFNSFFGHNAGYSNASGVNQAFFGYNSGYENTGSNNTFLGSEAGYYSGTGSNNVYIGTGAGRGGAGSNNVFIGAWAGYHETGSNKLYIEYDWNTDPLIYGEFDNDIVKINGSLGVNTQPSYQMHVVDTTSFDDSPAIYGVHTISDNWGIGVHGEGKYIGVRGYAANLTSGSAQGLFGSAYAEGTANAYGIYGIATTFGTGDAWAGYFDGNVRVTGTLDNTKSVIKIDHPLDPKNKYLVHSVVESPEMINVLSGVAIFNNAGKSIVKLPDYFTATNTDFRYQLTAIGAPGPNLHIEKEIENNEFIIAGGTPGMKASWEVTGVRNDPYAKKHPVIVEENKKETDKGKYLHPELYGKDNTYSIHGLNKNKK